MAKSSACVSLILFFTRGVSLKTWDDGGMLEREVALYRALRPNLRDITFVTYGDDRDLQYADRLDGIQILCNRWRLPERWYIFLVSRFYPWFWRGAVVMKSNQVQGADIALQAAGRFGKKFIARCGYLYSYIMENRHGSESPQARRASALEEQVFSAADRVVVTTFAMRQAVMQRYQLPEERVLVIPNYVDTRLFCPSPDGGRYAKRVCYVGRLDDEKNPAVLLEAVKGLDVELVIVGNGSLGERLRMEAGKNGLPVRFLGTVAHRQLPEILNSAAAFVLPSRYEGHPKALLEAMGCGLPVIGTDVPGVRELIRHRETGYLCGSSPGEIRAAIQEVLADGELRARMGRSAREFVVEHFAMEKIMGMELALLQDLVE